MFLATLFSALYFLTSPVTVPPSVEVIREYHLETENGRTQFLTEKLKPFATAAGDLNQEIEAMANTIKVLSPEKDQDKIIELTHDMLQKMARLTSMLNVLNFASSIEEDFKQIDTIVGQTTPLTPSQLEAADRIASLCKGVKNS
jgi:hypothetical protein